MPGASKDGREATDDSDYVDSDDGDITFQQSKKVIPDRNTPGHIEEVSPNQLEINSAGIVTITGSNLLSGGTSLDNVLLAGVQIHRILSASDSEVVVEITSHAVCFGDVFLGADNNKFVRGSAFAFVPEDTEADDVDVTTEENATKVDVTDLLKMANKPYKSLVKRFDKDTKKQADLLRRKFLSRGYATGTKQRRQERMKMLEAANLRLTEALRLAKTKIRFLQGLLSMPIDKEEEEEEEDGKLPLKGTRKLNVQESDIALRNFGLGLGFEAGALPMGGLKGTLALAEDGARAFYTPAEENATEEEEEVEEEEGGVVTISLKPSLKRPNDDEHNDDEHNDDGDRKFMRTQAFFYDHT